VKPDSDEAHSEFTPPMGVPLPAAPEPEGSAFAVPANRNAGAGASTLGNAFTPPLGVPLPSPPLEGSWQDRMREMIRMPIAERPVPEVSAEKPAAGLPVPRVLDLTLRIGELLLAGGEGAEDVEAAMLGVAHAYGLARVE